MKKHRARERQLEQQEECFTKWLDGEVKRNKLKGRREEEYREGMMYAYKRGRGDRV